MSKLSIDEIKKIATLARLGLSDDEIARFGSELSSILSFVDELQSVDTAGVAETSQVTGLTDVWRADEVRPSLVHPSDLLACAPETEDGFIKVKRVL